jgi:hypothetical protein
MFRQNGALSEQLYSVPLRKHETKKCGRIENEKCKLAIIVL